MTRSEATRIIRAGEKIMTLSEMSETDSPAGILEQPQPKREQNKERTTFQTLIVLFKARVVSLLLLAAVGGAFMAAGGWPGLGTLLIVLSFGGLAAGGAAGLNQYLEQGTDAIMGRTRQRPLVTGELQPRWVLWVSASMVLLPSLVALLFNPALGLFLALGAFIYVGLYTILLKPRTPLNIVIGGAAGSAAVMSGAAAAGNWQDPAVITLALLLFLWTPSHFWSLSILYKDDYAKAGVPMLPVYTTMKNASWWVLLHTAATGFVALLLAVSPSLGLAYFVPVLIATIDMIARNIRLIREPTPQNARGLFISSNIYLTVVLVAICAGTVIHSVWPPL
jgi:protoheme IX farnesyltransferase